MDRTHEPLPEATPYGPAFRRVPVRRRHRRWLHLTLFLVTAAAMTVAGSFWAGAFDRAAEAGGVIALISSRPGVLVRGIPFSLCLLAILGAHEMGHYLACRWYGIPATLPYFLPGPTPFGTFGAVIRIRGAIPHRRALFDVAAAGPLAGFAVAIPVLVVGLLNGQPTGAESVPGQLYLGPPLLSMGLESLIFPTAPGLQVGAIYVAGWFGMLVTSLNLFPVGQLDGGHAAYALSRRVHRTLARVTILGMIALVTFQFLAFPGFPSYTLWLVILLVMRDRHPRLLDEVSPLGRKRVWIALLLLAVFLLSFIPVPMYAS